MWDVFSYLCYLNVTLPRPPMCFIMEQNPFWRSKLFLKLEPFIVLATSDSQLFFSAHNVTWIPTRIQQIVTWIPTRIQQIVLQLILLLKEVQTLCALPFTYPAEALVKGLRLLLRLRILSLKLTHMLLPNPKFLDIVEGPELKVA